LFILQTVQNFGKSIGDALNKLEIHLKLDDE